ncbi:MAG: hypothetical protein HY231_04525 [Acidobacteria bacterium]|nr:hypothetical protein [Acidobacteriota bacterium]
MRKLISLNSLIAIVLLVTTAQADTIRLKNGSVLKGRVTSFSDEQFVIKIDSGSGRFMSTATIHIADIAKIDFDAAANSASETATQEPSSVTSNATPGEENPPRTNPLMKETREPVTAMRTPVKETVKEPGKESSKETPPVNPSLNTSRKGKAQPKVETLEPPVSKEPEVKEAEKVMTPEVTTTVPETRKPLGPNARVVNVEVAAKRDWTSSGVIVKRGDKLRITATGSITLDPAGQASGPDGIETPDARKLIADKPTGGLIGVIGADNDEFIFIGHANEFTATRDGLLFLSVNEGTLNDNSGSFKAVIEIAPQRPPLR